MPTLHNPASHRLACYRIGRILDADERVEITDDEAADLVNGAVFIVEGYREDSGPETTVDPEAADDETEGEDEPSATPRRTTAKRGGKRAEVTEAPEAETRG